MMQGIEIQIIACLIAAACAIPGVFLVLRKMSMTADSISHTVLLGIVLAFLVVQDLSSPILIISAAIIGVATVWLSELLVKTKLVASDSAIGVVFPLLFSVAIILISLHASNVHLDVDAVLLGEIAFAPFNRLIVGGVDIGPKALYIGLVLLIINLAFVILYYKQLVISTFDPVFATVLGFSPVIVHYVLMTLVSITAVGAFDVVGSILVVALMICPPITAYLLTSNLKWMIAISVFVGALSGLLGYWGAIIYDVSIAGMIAVCTGVIFGIVLLVAPKRGLVAKIVFRKLRRDDFDRTTLLVHVHQHDHTEDNIAENGLSTICEHLDWDSAKVSRVVKSLVSRDFLYVENDVLVLTDKGAAHAEGAIVSLKLERG